MTDVELAAHNATYVARMDLVLQAYLAPHPAIVKSILKDGMGRIVRSYTRKMLKHYGLASDAALNKLKKGPRQIDHFVPVAITVERVI